MVKEGDNIIHDLTFGQLNCPHLASVWTEGEWYFILANTGMRESKPNPIGGL